MFDDDKLYSEKPSDSALFAPPSSGIGLGPRSLQADVQSDLRSMPTLSKIGLALQEMGAGIQGRPSPIDTFTETKRRERVLQRQEFKLQLEALDDGMKMLERLQPDDREQFATSFAAQLDRQNPGSGETFKALSKRPDISKLLGKYTDIPMAKMSLAADPSGKSLLKLLGTTEGLKMAETQLDQKALPVVSEKVRIIAQNWQQLVPPEMVEKFNKDGVLSQSEVMQANDHIREKYPKLALDEAQLQVMSRNSDAVFTPLGIMTGKKEQDVLADAAKQANKPDKAQSDLGKLKADLDRGLITPEDFEAKKRKLTTHAPPVVVNPVNTELKLADDYRADSKGFKDTKAKFEAATKYYADVAKGKQPTPAGDRALIFGYAKMLDPGDKVAVKDLQDIDKLAGVPERVIQGVKNLIAGKLLPNEVRKDIFQIMRSEFTQHNRAQRQIESEYSERAKRYKLDPKNVVIPYGLEME